MRTAPRYRVDRLSGQPRPADGRAARVPLHRPPMRPPPSTLASERAALLAWFDAVARDLPWRRSRDPYAIWVSEVMLQQTRVDTVLRYFDRFLSRFPDPRALASASEDEVLSMWSGLGYYRRARLLHAGSKHLVAHHGGEVPQDPEARRAMPGVGRYTAGAIGSIAFARPEAIVDGNVARVLSRLRGIDTPLGRADTEARLWAEADALVPGPRPGALNQALMELGATVCAHPIPRCADCPVAGGCVALRTGRTAELPVPKPRRAPRPVDVVAVVARQGRGVWMIRGQDALFGGLWGVPLDEGKGRAAAERALISAGLRGTLERRAQARLEHVLTHRRMDVRVFVAADAHPMGEGARWVDPDAPGDIGLSALTRKILAAAGPSGTASPPR